MNDPHRTLVFDIGGTKLSAGLADRQGRITHRQELPTLASEGRDAILQRIDRLGHTVLAEADGVVVAAVGAATAGQADSATGVVVYATPNLPGWSGLDLAARMQAMFGRPVVIENDVKAMGLGEMCFGAARGCAEALCLTVGTGIGGAVISGGRVLHGFAGGAGEIGHFSIDGLNGRPCNCGSKGCLETYASTRALLGDFKAAHRHSTRPEFAAKKVEQWTAQDVARAYATHAQAEWPELHAVVNQAADWLGIGLAALFNVLDPQMIVVGGSIQLFGEPYLCRLQSALVEKATRLIRPLPVIFSSVGADGGLLGAAVLAWSRVDGA
jgi:glucokinase